MLDLAWRPFCALVVGLVMYKGVAGQCNFPQAWRNKKWMQSRVDYLNKTLELMTYQPTYSYLSYSPSPNVEHLRYTCEQFETVNNRHTYIRSTMIDGVQVKRCVRESMANGVILHRETNETLSMSDCKASLAAVDLFTIYSPVTLAGNDYDLEISTTCPFANFPYLINYRIDQLEECVNDRSSVLNVYDKTIFLLACNYQVYSRLPLTGTLNCLSHFSATELDESNEENGGVLIFQWNTKTQNTAFIYCARYHTYPDKTVSMSVDITSYSDVRCQQNSNYSWYEPYKSRDYVRYNLEYKEFLVSPTPGVTFSTTRPTPNSPTTTTAYVPDQPINVQVAVELPFANIPSNRDAFSFEIRKQFATAASVNESHFGEPIFSQSTDGNLVITLVLDDPTTDIRDRLTQVANSGQFTFALDNQNDVIVKSNSIYMWRETDNCPTSPCANGGTCWNLQGVYSCQCPSLYAGVTCSDLVEASEPVNVQVAVDMLFSDIPTDTTAFNADIRNKLATAASIPASRIGEPILSASTSDKLVVTVPVTNPSEALLRNLETATNNGGLAFDNGGTSVSVMPNSFYKWQDDHKCSSSVCANGGKCWILQGTYSCMCLASHTGQFCETKVPSLQPINFQMALDLPFANTPSGSDRIAFDNEIKTTLATVANINSNSIGKPIYSQSPDDKLVVTVVVSDPTAAIIASLESPANSGDLSFQIPDGVDVSTLPNTVFKWRDTDNCETEPCLNEGKCWILQGNYSCACTGVYRGARCDIEVAPDGSTGGMSSTTRIIIIVVCCVAGVAVIVIVIVFVLRRQKKVKKANSDSEAGYDNNGTLDDQDREMYSTINKKPKAYHDKSFTNSDEKGNGELTGIHL